jgi:hypothetical protein
MTPREELRRDSPEAIEAPAPTVWPFVTAVGVTLGFAGLVTHAAVTGVGLLLALCGFVGWMRQVFPVERTELIPLRPPDLRARAASTSRRTIEHLRLGEASHRVRVPVAVRPYSAGAWAGSAGGVAMAGVAILFGLLVQRSPWYPINLMAAVGLPSLAGADLSQLRAFNGIALAVGIIVHGALSVLVGLLYAVILPTLPRYPVLWAGFVAPALWTALVWSTLGLVNPVLNQRIEWGWFVASQIAFGLAAGWVISRAQPVATMQTWPLAARMGIESPGVFDEEKQ